MKRIVCALMGQSVGIVSKRTLRPGLVRYALDRSLTGVSHESYSNPALISGDRPSDVLARRLFETGGVSAVHIHSNVVTVTFEPSADEASGDDDRFEEILQDLYIHYLPGVRPTPV